METRTFLNTFDKNHLSILFRDLNLTEDRISYLNSIKNTISDCKEKVQPKMSFTHPHIVLNLYDFLFSVEYKRKMFSSIKWWLADQDDWHLNWAYILYTQCCLDPTNFQNLLLCYMVGTTWTWENTDSILIFGCTVTLNASVSHKVRSVDGDLYYIDP